ncbi:helix-turn-helix domain-containing protein [Methylophilus methylotrophus]|uniref:helix-turn-helix domain-containing protein n=1 Tax=Methylophilus methylotrophus TaxID=17 RepID=UPI00037B1E04|nr:helix-turn-helix domain-containing protein [Methylophilus methylotrophus]
MGNCDFLERTDNMTRADFHLIKRETSDVMEQAEALPLWSQDYTQLGKGVFSGSIKSIHHNGIQIFSERMNRAVDQIASAPKDCLVIGLPTRVEGDSTWGLLPVQPLSLITLGKNADLYFRTSANSEIIAAVIPISKIQAFTDKIEWPEFEDALRTIKPVEMIQNDVSQSLLRTLAYGLQSVNEHSDQSLLSEIWASYEEDLLASSVQALLQASKNAHPFYVDHRIPRYIVNQVRHLTISRDGFPLSIDEICDHLRIKRRTLNAAFARALGVTPLTYMRNLKLHKVRMNLITPQNDKTSICETASRWGFVHMSLFSKYYKELFGEYPNETLHRERVR